MDEQGIYLFLYSHIEDFCSCCSWVAIAIFIEPQPLNPTHIDLHGPDDLQDPQTTIDYHIIWIHQERMAWMSSESI
jgi:hypothetical protein